MRPLARSLLFVLAVAQSGFASLTWWMRPSGSGPGVDAHPLGQVCTALGQVRTASGQVLTPFPPAIHPPYYVLYAIVTTAQIQDTMSPQRPWLMLSVLLARGGHAELPDEDSGLISLGRLLRNVLWSTRYHGH